MEYSEFRDIFNSTILSGQMAEVLEKMAKNPHRFVGLLRPSTPRAKIYQYILQSREIRMGDALEIAIEALLKDSGLKALPKSLESDEGDTLEVDLLLAKDDRIFMIEQKVRDDHDSTKKRGQVENFQKKLAVLHKRWGGRLVGVIYFIDPSFHKNRRYYAGELRQLQRDMSVEMHLFYGKDLFDFFETGPAWDHMMEWLETWRKELPELTDVDMDRDPDAALTELETMDPRLLNKLMKNDELWAQGYIRAVFPTGETLQLLRDHFKRASGKGDRKLAALINYRLGLYERGGTVTSN